jgi:hypothetical protein
MSDTLYSAFNQAHNLQLKTVIQQVAGTLPDAQRETPTPVPPDPRVTNPAHATRLFTRVWRRPLA